MRTYSTSQFEIRIKNGLLEMRTEGLRTAAMGAEPEQALDSLLASAPVRAVSFDVRASDFRVSAVQLACRVRHIGRQCRGLPIAFIGRVDQEEQIRLAVTEVEAMNGTARGFRSRSKAHAWLRSACQQA